MANEFEIRIKTSADLKATQALKKALEDQIAATKRLGGDSSGLQAQLSKVNAALRDAATSSTASASGLGKLSELLSSKLAGGIALATTALVALKKAVGEFAGKSPGSIKRSPTKTHSPIAIVKSFRIWPGSSKRPPPSRTINGLASWNNWSNSAHSLRASAWTRRQ